MSMPLDLSIESGTSAYANPQESLTDQLFGVRYTTYRGVDSFLDQIDDANIGVIVWPGGTLSETRDDRYGFEYDGLQNPAYDRPGLSEMMATAPSDSSVT